MPAIRTEAEGAVLIVTLDRPPVNALDAGALGELTAVFEGVAEDTAVRAIILTGVGPAFCAGADIEALVQHDSLSGPLPSSRVASDLFNLMEAHPKPVVAAINGACLGAGDELALACDFRLAASTATFGHPELGLGLVPGWGGLQRLPRLVGRARALDLLLTGRTVGAEEARAFGLVGEVVEPGGLASRARELGRALAAMPPLAVAAVKDRVARGLSDRQGQAIRDDEWTLQDLLTTEDGQEGLRAFLEGRPPVWRGR